MHVLRTVTIAVLIGASMLASTSVCAEDADGKRQARSPPSRLEAGKDSNGTAKALPPTSHKQRAIDAAARAGSTQGGTALGDRGPPKPEKTWDEMTPQEQDAARKRWLLNSGDFGPRRGIPRATPSPSTEKGGAVIDGARPRTPQEKIRTK